MREITTGEMPMVTSFAGASAAPSHAPAVNPHTMPRICRLLDRAVSCVCRAESRATVPCMILRRNVLVNEPQQQQPAHQHGHRHPKMNILKHTHKSRKSCLICQVVGHKSPAQKPGRRELYPRELFVTNGPVKVREYEGQ